MAKKSGTSDNANAKTKEWARWTLPRTTLEETLKIAYALSVPVPRPINVAPWPV